MYSYVLLRARYAPIVAPQAIFHTPLRIDTAQVRDRDHRKVVLLAEADKVKCSCHRH